MNFKQDPALGESVRFGMQSVKALLLEAPQQVLTLWVQADLPRLSELAVLAQRVGVSVEKMPKHQLEKRLRSRLNDLDEVETLRHQGVVAILQSSYGQSSVASLSFEELCDQFQAKIAEKGHALVIVLDGVTDPRNVGAVLRVAEGAGALGVIIPKHGSATHGPIMSKASAGADVTMPLVTVTNLARALETLKKVGGWVVAADCSSEAQAAHTLKFPNACILLMGSEGKGIRRLVGEQADFRLSIPMLGQVSSLNVSVACGILAYQWVSAYAVAVDSDASK
jgi:23S rRNA (guanosine2251-2'-O)-methyltransferase